MLFTKDDIWKILRSFNPNKAHAYYMISHRKLKIWGDPLLKSLELIFNNTLRVENFTRNGKKKILYHFIKNDKQLIENYRFILLLPVCGKVVGRFIYMRMFKFFTEKWLISLDQSWFKPADQFYMSKSIEKVWYKGLLYKIKQNLLVLV